MEYGRRGHRLRKSQIQRKKKRDSTLRAVPGLQRLDSSRKKSSTKSQPLSARP
jgi:hypothetical protein